MNKFVQFMQVNAVRVYGFLVALMALVLHYVPALPGDLVLGVVAAAIALFGGEVVQRTENRKTSRNYWRGFESGHDSI